jgi:two-component system, OmpR family, response regulator VanR
MNKSILVVEDDAYIQELIVEFLKTQDYDVELANDGIEAIEKFKDNNYDLIILDIMLPNLDGYSVCKMIRNTSKVPIIFLTALGDEKDEVKGFELQADDYITKPFSFNILIKRVEALLRRTEESKNKSISKFEDLTLDCDAYRVYFNNELLDLTVKEFNILKMLIDYYPKVVTRDVLVDEIWGYDYYRDKRIVDAHIKNIRKKSNIPYIKTVMGVGYTLER